MENQNEDSDRPSKRDYNINEPRQTYLRRPGPKKIVFSTLAEQEEDNYYYWLSLTPEQRLESVTILIKKVYANQLQSAAKLNRIFFDKV